MIMKVIIAGSRDFNDYDKIKAGVKASGFDITEVVSGGASGADKLGEKYAEEHGIPITIFPAEWGKYGRSAGPRRNGIMADYADALIAFPIGASIGTRNMIEKAQGKKLKIHIVEE
jgi:hypothetical protein